MKKHFTLFMALCACILLKAQSPKVYYPFDGQSLNSTVGNYPLGTVNGTAAFTTATQAGNGTHALSLDGSKYEAATFLYDTSTTGFTLSFWMKRQPNDYNGVLVSQLDVVQGSGMTNYYGTFNSYVSPDGHVAMELYTSNMSSSTIFSHDTVSFDWNLVTFTWDGNMKYVYINGQINDSSSGPVAINKQNADVDLRIGAIKYYPMGAQPTFLSAYIGDIDEVRMYETALTAQQIQSLYSTGVVNSIANINQNIAVSVYPNPANNTLNIRSAVPAISVMVYNTLGEEVLQTSTAIEALDIAALNSGLYSIHLKTAEGTAIRKFIKQ